MNAYNVASTFGDRGIHPPAEDSVTVGESDLNFIHLCSGDDSGLLQYVRSGGIAFPHIMIPEALQLRGASASVGDVAGTLSAALAERLQVEEANKEKEMLAKTEGPVACVAWHPHRSLVAIAHRATDTIFLYDLTTNSWCPNVLQNIYMQGITSMVWQPNCGYTLAVGSTAGVCLWNIMPSATGSSSNIPAAVDGQKAPSLGTGQMSAWMTLLSFPSLIANGIPAQLPLDKKVVLRRSSASVSSLAFSPSGQWLVSGHQTHGHLTFWDVALGTATPLKRSGSSSRAATLRVGISPNGRYLVSAHANGQLRLWETESWTSRVWSDLQGNITQFAWAPDSRSLFFAVAKSSDIYALALYKAASSIDAEVSVVTSFEAHATAVLNGGDGAERIRVGGAIKSLAIDPSGQRLVVGFDDDSASSDISLLAVYLVNTDALFRAGGDSSALMPLGYVRGPDWGEQQQQKQQGTGSDGSSRPSSGRSSVHGLNTNSSKPPKKRVRLGPPIPSWFGFAPNFTHGALLNVAWANGKISFVPMFFKTNTRSN
ncbi:hypothetical protein IW140_005406 [Coemansia sp. RSA 1813]|nr:hypothetical protein LPJ74_004375 [Coemansia sp. RSA 1843]KAJ2565293.1 hypothetical protein IW140_005406 [Coemansia sp. RSA 1813]